MKGCIMANRQETQRMLDLTCAMWDDPWVMHYQDLDFAPDEVSSIFLGGPSSRQDILEYKWRAFAVHYLRAAGYKGVIYVPEPRNNDWSFKDAFPMKIVQWESGRLLRASVKMFWIPRHETQLPGRVTNTEFGFFSGALYAAPEKFKDRVFVGFPPEAWKVNSEKHWATIAGVEQFDNLPVMCTHVAHKLPIWTNY
jgi:hypothetical protein